MIIIVITITIIIMMMIMIITMMMIMTTITITILILTTMLTIKSLFTINSLEKKKKLFILNTIYNSCRFKKHLI